MAFTPTEDFYVNLPEELNFWGARVTKRILSNFDKLNINKTPGGKGKQYTGDLYRNVWWTVFNSSGGNEVLIEFYFMHYAGYVQTGTGRGDPRIALPPMKSMEQIDRPDGHKRKAKPFLRSEIRLHVMWLTNRLFQQYNFGGDLYLIKGIAEAFNDTTITKKWIEENKHRLTKETIDYARGIY